MADKNDLINRKALPDKPMPSGPRPGPKVTPQMPKPGPKPDPNAPKRYAKGGMVRGDGCASKGKTKGRFC